MQRIIINNNKTLGEHIMQEKKTFVTPELTIHGNIETITQSGTTGGNFDGNFQLGQPVPTNPNGQPVIFS